MRVRRLIAGLLVCLIASPAWAGSGTITVLDSGGTTRTFDVITDASSHFVSMMGVCDGSAAAQCAAVKAASTAAVAGDPALVVAVSPNNSVAVTGTVTANIGTSGVAQGSTTSGQSVALIGCATVSSAPTNTNAQTNAVTCGTNGAANVNVLGTAAVTQSTSPWVDNITQFGGTNLSTGTGPGGAGIPRVTVSNDSSVLVNGGCAGQTIANTKVKPISITSGTAIVAGVSSTKVYICAIDLVVSAADNVALVEGTTVTTPCDTSTAGMAGGTTAATGWNLAANGGLTKGNGAGLLYITATAADNVCLLVSGAAQVSGAITYAQF